MKSRIAITEFLETIKDEIKKKMVKENHNGLPLSKGKSDPGNTKQHRNLLFLGKGILT
jgi:hypothetical protein